MKFTPTHEWIEIQNGIATIGITAYAQQELGEVVFIQLPKLHLVIKAGAEVAVLESTKAASDLYSPVSGEVVEVNGALSSDPGLINRDPEGKGWLFKVRGVPPEEMSRFMNRDEYLRMIG